MRNQRDKLSRHPDAAKAMDDMLKRWEAFSRFLNDGGICLTAEHALQGVATRPESRADGAEDPCVVVPAPR